MFMFSTKRRKVTENTLHVDDQQRHRPVTRLFSRPEHGLNSLSMLGQSQMEIYSIYIHTHIYMYIHIPIITLILLTWFHRAVVSMLGSREQVVPGSIP